VKKLLHHYFKNLGPGLTTGAADDDPSGIATYSQMGATGGLKFAWLAFFSLPLMVAVQEMCARIGIATGVGLAANIRKHYSRKVLYFCTSLLLFANVFNIGADLGAMAEGVRLLLPNLSFSFLVIAFALSSLSLQVFISYKQYAKYLKYLAITLVAYIVSAFFVDINWGEVANNIVFPDISFTRDTIILICAGLGTTISPYLFFWQTDQEIEEQILKGDTTEKSRRADATPSGIRKMRLDVFSGMFFSNLVMFFIIVTCAETLFANGIHSINTASDAALALRPLAGDFAFLLFTLGIVGTGMLSIPVLAGSASYAMSEAFGWKIGLYRKLKQARAFYGVIALAMVLGMVLNFVGLDPIKTLIYSAVLNGIISPLMIFFIVQISASEKIMGEFKNGAISNILGTISLIIMFCVSVATLVFLLL